MAAERCASMIERLQQELAEAKSLIREMERSGATAHDLQQIIRELDLENQDLSRELALAEEEIRQAELTASAR